jgi:hypothetical protein
MLRSRILPALLFVCLAAALPVQSAELVRDHLAAAKLKSAAARKAKVEIHGIALGRASLATLELEPMQVWAKDAKIAVFDAKGEATYLAPPTTTQYFRGRIAGEDDSAVFVSMTADRIDGMILSGEQRFTLGSGVRLDRSRKPSLDEPLFVVPNAVSAEVSDPAAQWTCGVENEPALSLKLEVPESTIEARRIRTDAGTVTNAAYTLRLAIETDVELRNGFASEAALVAYIADLVGKASVIYQRDLNTTLTIGHTNIYNDGIDPWAVQHNAGTSAALAELAKYYHDTNTADYAQLQRSAVVMLSGKSFYGGVAWINALCEDDFYCGDSGQRCGSPDFAGSYAGGYAFCGSLNVPSTVTPDPTSTVNGVQYGVPASGNFWMLLQFAHELGHVANGPHTHCVGLTAQEKTLYGVGTTSLPDREWVDTCAVQGNCFMGSPTYPTEFGSIMSYCHNVVAATGYRASRYLFGKSGEASHKMLSYFLDVGLPAATPNATMTIGTAPLACAAQNASVTPCAGCTYQWQITGGTIDGSSTSASVNFTPSSGSVTLSITLTNAKGCGVTNSITRTASCAAVLPPASLTATGSAANVNVTWTASAGATSYNVYRSTNNTTYTLVGSTVATAFNDATVSANTAYLYRVRAVNGGESADSPRDLATTISWVDPVITAGSTPFRAAHIDDLRTAANALRTLTSLGAATFTDATPASCKAVHITELRASIQAALAVLGTAPSWSDPSLAAGTTIQRTHVQELRAAVE